MYSFVTQLTNRVGPCPDDKSLIFYIDANTAQQPMAADETKEFDLKSRSEGLNKKSAVRRHSSRDPDYNLWGLLSRTRDVIFKARANDLVPIGLTPRQASALLVIAAIGDKATPAEISRRLFREPHSVSGLLKRMERDGLVRQTDDLERKNLIRVTLTEKGQQVLALSKRNESLHRIFSSLSEEQRQQLELILEILLIAAVEEFDGSGHRELTIFLARLLNKSVQEVELKRTPP